MAEPLDIAWAAGFLEGEGCFGWYGGGLDKHGRKAGRGSPLVAVSQIDREPLAKLADIFDGTLRKHGRLTSKHGNEVWEFRCTGLKAVLIMQTVLPLLSQRKANRVMDALLRWHERQEEREAERARVAYVCPRGHLRSEHGRQRKTGVWYCLACHAATRNAHRDGAAIEARAERIATMCAHGHLRSEHGRRRATGEDAGQWYCLECQRQRQRKPVEV